MARTIHQIKQELEHLETNVAALAVDLQTNYQSYLQTLGKSAARQLILACYQVCTRCYPQAFLNLSVSQREKLQQSLQKIGNEIEQKLLLLNNKYSEYKNYLEPEKNQEKPLFNKGDWAEKIDSENELQRKESGLEIANSQNNQQLNIKNPEKLVTWQSEIEIGINQVLKNASKEANCLLLQQGMFPQKFPEKLFEIALQAEEKNSISAGIPNLLNLLIEKNKDGEAQAKRVDPITAVKLRLSEIEFADSNLDRERAQIRSLLSTLEKIKEQYRLKQRECAIAEAEAAWRAVWYEQ